MFDHRRRWPLKAASNFACLAAFAGEGSAFLPWIHGPKRSSARSMVQHPSSMVRRVLVKSRPFKLLRFLSMFPWLFPLFSLCLCEPEPHVSPPRKHCSSSACSLANLSLNGASEAIAWAPGSVSKFGAGVETPEPQAHHIRFPSC